MANQMKLLGARLKELRKTTGKSQDQLSEKIGIESKYLSRIETGNCYPSVEILVKIADVLQVEMLELFNYSHLNSDVINPRGIEAVLAGASKDEMKLAYKIIKAIRR